VYDPEATDNARAAAPALTYATSVEEALSGADVVLLLTDWPEFTQLDPRWAATLVRRRCIIDGRNRLDHDRWRLEGWAIQGVGRGSLPVPGVRAAPVLPVQPARRRSLLERT
jgi:UDPglucose 6-dehydrogenase